MITIEKIARLREQMKRLNLAAFIIPSSDPHLSEYVAPHWKSREWLSGFTGSAGTIVITSHKAGLWTDSRYYIQAEKQIQGSGIELHKEGLPATPTIPEYLIRELQPNEIAGIDGSLFSVNAVRSMQTALSKYGIKLHTKHDPLKEIWKDRPGAPTNKAYIYPTKYAGKSCSEKLLLIREELRRNEVDALLTSALDEICWTLNLRGSDVKHTPVFICNLIITQQSAHLFIDPAKRSKEVDDYLIESQIHIHDYDSIHNFLNTLQADNLQFDPSKTNYNLYSHLPSSCQTNEKESPIALLKAVRNTEEIKGIHHAMIKDGIALVKFLHWLEQAVPTGKETEVSIDQKLYEYRASQELFIDRSFDTIAGYKENAAIVHYSATQESDTLLQSKGFLLLDSGAQYFDGTTDITRTIALGELTDEEKRDYTLVLKGHIALSLAKFPSGTRGAQLDVLARMPLWQNNMNFLHGTGHGVGHFLSVHEGPQSIRMNENPVVLLPGMILSNEPGVYKKDSHGIRTENLMLVVEDAEGLFGTYLKFETLTLCPICTQGIIKELLTREELIWLNQYHQTVYSTLSPYLDEKEVLWLKDKTHEI